MGWNRKQQEREQKKLKGQKDWSRDERKQVKEFLRRYEHGNHGRKAG